jgi:hypothetical protein
MDWWELAKDLMKLAAVGLASLLWRQVNRVRRRLIEVMNDHASAEAVEREFGELRARIEALEAKAADDS